MEMQGFSRLMRNMASFAGHILHFTPWGHHPFGQAVAVQLLARGPWCGQQGPCYSGPQGRFWCYRLDSDDWSAPRKPASPSGPELKRLGCLRTRVAALGWWDRRVSVLLRLSHLEDRGGAGIRKMEKGEALRPPSQGLEEGGAGRRARWSWLGLRISSAGYSASDPSSWVLHGGVACSQFLFWGNVLIAVPRCSRIPTSTSSPLQTTLRSQLFREHLLFAQQVLSQPKTLCLEHAD